jgi:hypothetical protein
MACGRLAVFFSILAASAFGQMDGSTLRTRFGAPLNREVFTVRPGIEMIVDYSPTGNQVCRLELPGQARMPADAPVGVGINREKAIGTAGGGRAAFDARERRRSFLSVCRHDRDVLDGL